MCVKLQSTDCLEECHLSQALNALKTNDLMVQATLFQCPGSRTVSFRDRTLICSISNMFSISKVIGLTIITKSFLIIMTAFTVTLG